MTPGEQQYDQELIKSARNVAVQISSRSRRVATVINQLCDRLSALSGSTPVTTPQNTPEIPPASAPAEPVKGHGKNKRRR